MQPTKPYASAGEAMETTSQVDHPIGLYRLAANNSYVGCLDVQAANAAARVGFELVKEGREAAMKTDAEIAEIIAKKAKAPEGDK